MSKLRKSKLIYLNIVVALCLVFAITITLWGFSTHFGADKAGIVANVIMCIGSILITGCFSFWTLEAHWLFKFPKEEKKSKE